MAIVPSQYHMCAFLFHQLRACSRFAQPNSHRACSLPQKSKQTAIENVRTINSRRARHVQPFNFPQQRGERECFLHSAHEIWPIWVTDAKSLPRHTIAGTAFNCSQAMWYVDDTGERHTALHFHVNRPCAHVCMFTVLAFLFVFVLLS